MKRVLILLFCFALNLSVFAGGSRVVRGVVESDILKCSKEYVVYLPNGYDENSDTKYPVLYLLHGAWGTCNDWTKLGNAHIIADELVQSQLTVPMIIVMPDARGELDDFSGTNMGYFNQPDWRYEDFFFEEFMPTIEQTYNIDSRKERRAISGLSMGGGGATVYAQRHAELFGYSAPMSSLFDIAPSRLDKPNASFTQSFMNSVVCTSPLSYVENATDEDVKSLQSVRWYFDCGDDDYLLDTNFKLFLEMNEKAIPMEVRVRNGGHTWVYWQISLSDVLRFISIGFSQAR